MGLGLDKLFCRIEAHREVAAHAQVEKSGISLQVNEQELTPPTDALNSFSDDLLCKLTWGRIRYSLLP